MNEQDVDVFGFFDLYGEDLEGRGGPYNEQEARFRREVGALYSALTAMDNVNPSKLTEQQRAFLSLLRRSNKEIARKAKAILTYQEREDEVL